MYLKNVFDTEMKICSIYKLHDYFLRISNDDKRKIHAETLYSTAVHSYRISQCCFSSTDKTMNRIVIIVLKPEKLTFQIPCFLQVQNESDKQKHDLVTGSVF